MLGAGVRFLWISDLERPDVMLLGLVTGLSITVMMAAPASAGRTGAPTAALIVSAALTVGLLWSASSALILAIGASSAVSLLQNVILRRGAP